MNRPMRRKDRLATEEETIEMLNEGIYGVLAICGNDNMPYGVPLNYAYANGAIYFHCAKTGHKLDIINENNNVCFTVVTKSDVAACDEIRRIYEKAGYPVFCTGEDDGRQLEQLRNLMKGRLSAFSGNSGVGKSTLLNKLFPQLELETGRISKKLGRGKHTTRQVEIFQLEDCMVADTPGFSSVELDYDNFISKDDLQHAFIEFEGYIGDCKFRDCSHTGEIGCKIKTAVEEEKIAQSRYDSYCVLYERQKNIKDWEL